MPTVMSVVVALVSLALVLAPVVVILILASLDPDPAGRDAQRRAPPDALPTPPSDDVVLEKEDVAWTREGDLFVGRYRDYLIQVRGEAESEFRSFYAMVTVRRHGGIVDSSGGHSYEIAIDKGLGIVRRQLRQERRAERSFAALTGQPAAVAVPDRGPAVRARYMS